MTHLPYPILLIWDELTTHTRPEDYEIQQGPFHWLHFASEVSLTSLNTDWILAAIFHDVGRIKPLDETGQANRRFAIMMQHSLLKGRVGFIDQIRKLCQSIDEGKGLLGDIHETLSDTPEVEIKKLLEIGHEYRDNK